MADNVLTRKIGPLPTWGWVSIAGGTIIIWAVWQRHNQASAQAQQQQSAYAPGTVPPVIMQNYGTPEGPETTNIRITTPPDQDGHRDDEDDEHRKGPHRHHNRKRHRPHPGPVDIPGGPERHPPQWNPGGPERHRRRRRPALDSGMA